MSEMINEEEVYRFLDTLPTAHLAVREGVVVYANPAANKLFGREMPGTPAAELFGGEVPAPESGSAAVPIKLDGGAVTAVIGRLGEAVTVTVEECDRDPERTRALAEAMTVAIRQYASMCSLAVDQARKRAEDVSDVTALTCLSVADRAVHGLTRLADNSERLFISGVAGYEFAPMSVTDLVSDMVTTTAALAHSKEIRFSFSSPDGDVRCMGDAKRLEIMLMELLSNAMKHSRPGMTVSVTVRRSRDGAMITVSDHGGGVRPEELRGVFERYVTPRPTADATDGAGLGLGVAQRIAEAHGGRIVLESTAEGVSATASIKDRPPTGVELNEPADRPGNSAETILTHYADVLDAGVYLDKENM